MLRLNWLDSVVCPPPSSWLPPAGKLCCWLLGHKIWKTTSPQCMDRVKWTRQESQCPYKVQRKNTTPYQFEYTCIYSLIKNECNHAFMQFHGYILYSCIYIVCHYILLLLQSDGLIVTLIGIHLDGFLQLPKISWQCMPGTGARHISNSKGRRGLRIVGGAGGGSERWQFFKS